MRIIKLIALFAICGSLWLPLFCHAEPNPGLFKVEIRDIDNQLMPPVSSSTAPKKTDHWLFNLSAQNKEDQQFVRQLWETYGPVFDFRDWDSLGPDSSYRQIRLIYEGKTLILNSWHPIYEQNPGAVVTSRGVTSLDGRSRAEVMEADDQHYIAKRSAFDAIVDRC